MILAVVVVCVWVPIRWSKLGLALYAIGSSRNAAFLAGVNVARTRILAYAIGGGLAGLGGLTRQRPRASATRSPASAPATR